MKHYDFLIVGAGLFGSVCAYELSKKGKSVLIIEKRNHIGGNIYTEQKEGITVHKYGAHIFHTNDEKVWKFVNYFVKFNNFENNVIADYKGERYHLPFNMNTFKEIWSDVKTVEDAKRHINKEIEQSEITNPKNLEEQAISQVGKTIYTKLIKDYTEKQWHKPCNELPASIIKRLPVRFEYNNNYFNDKYQGIPVNGYSELIEKLLDGIDIKLNTDYISNREYYDALADKVIYTGPIDELFGYCLGMLEYRSLVFKEKKLNKEDFQGNAVINYTSHDKKYTRIIEHKHFNNDKSNKTIIYEEYPDDWCVGKERFYTINDNKNAKLYNSYKELANKNPKLILGGRLGNYKYYDMDDAIKAALDLVETL